MLPACCTNFYVATARVQKEVVKMKNYEVLYAIDKDVNEANRKKLIERMNTFITKNGGTDIAVNEWGIKKFAYAINFKNEGFYVLVNFKANADVPNKIENEMNIVEEIVRHKVTLKI
jgi:small subunit ribosomal protein S6